MTTKVVRDLAKADLKAAEDGSWYTIIGAGGPAREWVEGVEKLLAEKGIDKPVAWYRATGKDVNEYVGSARPQDQFQPDLALLLFPLDGMDVGRLAMFKMQMQDRWFDDVVQNMRFAFSEEEED